MPTTYTGVPTAAEAPSPVPTPNALPVLTIPIDGEGASIASIIQGFKTLADFTAWLSGPRALSTVWASKTWMASSPNGEPRFTLDHSGFQAWGLQSIRETWSTNESVGGSTSNGDLTKTAVPWHWDIIGTNFITAAAPSVSAGQSQYFRTMLMRVSATSGDTSQLGMPNVPALYDQYNTISMEWAACIDTVGANNITWKMGLASGAPASTTVGAFFRKLSTDTNWQCVTNNGSTETVVNSGVTPTANNFNRFRVVWNGSAVDDSGLNRCLFFVDGVLVANMTSTIPPTGAAATPLFLGTQTAASSTRTMSIGPTWLTTNDGPMAWL